MKLFIILFLILFIPGASFSATPEQCYVYITELVRSSDFPFSKWKTVPDKINIIVDDDNDKEINAKLFFETEGTGSIGWIRYDKITNKLYNTSADLEKPVDLTFNNEFSKAWHYCQVGESVYKVSVKGRVYFNELTNGQYKKTEVFIVHGDYVKVIQSSDRYSLVEYQTKTGQMVKGWLLSDDLKKIDFISSW